MVKRVNGKTRTIDVFFIILTIIIIMMVSSCLQDKTSAGVQVSQVLQTPVQTEAPKTAIESVSGELNMLNSKGWTKLAEQLGRPRTTALLWYHLKTKYSIDTKVAFGNPKKLDAAIAIAASAGGDSPFPKIIVKGVEYYIIDPMTPAVAGEFKYGDMFDDPGNTYLSYSYFRLFPEDIDIIKQWVKETGVTIIYTDFPAK